ncbi:MAG TPA: enoyl-CoA hydratase-related protein, partial [Hyphomicrobiales bacterium]|nr:enoyl-CoA hydratase-related protein [Hyphomicrobiales bacterium]
MAEAVLWERRGEVGWITLNRPERRNALTDEAVGLVAGMLDQAAAEPGLRAVVLTGAGDKAFCAGGDLKPAEGGTFDHDFSQPSTAAGDLFRRVRRFRLPLVARVNGHCLAGGMGLLAMCDLAVAADTALFGLPEVKVGVFPMQVLSVLQHLVPRRVLTELCLTGELISAAEAKAIGLLNHVVPPAELDARTDWLLARLVDKSPTAQRRGKFAMRAAEEMGFEQAI